MLFSREPAKFHQATSIISLKKVLWKIRPIHRKAAEQALYRGPGAHRLFARRVVSGNFQSEKPESKSILVVVYRRAVHHRDGRKKRGWRPRLSLIINDHLIHLGQRVNTFPCATPATSHSDECIIHETGVVSVVRNSIQ